MSEKRDRERHTKNRKKSNPRKINLQFQCNINQNTHIFNRNRKQIPESL